MKKSQKKSQKIVIKVGSSILTGGSNVIVAENLNRIVKHMARLVQEGQKVIVVTSGAIASGLSVLGLKRKPKELELLQAAAAAGQNILMQSYSQALAQFNLKCAQILLTKEDFQDRQRYLNARHTINALLHCGVIPIINENDAISVDEIKFGDNDTLSARVAAAVEADGLLILTDIDGLYESFNAKTGRHGALLKEVTALTPEIKKMACGTDKDSCVGGMSTKLVAVSIAASAGITVILAKGSLEDLNISFDAKSYDDFDGTRFPVVNFKGGSKKHWLAFEAKTKGRVMVDEGARNALVEKSKSLLAPGITSVEGHFKTDEIVEIADHKGGVFAKGKVNFSSQELLEIKGKKAKDEVIHRDNLVVLG